LVILDACRNNPFSSVRRTGATRSVQMLGLAPVEPADNVLVAYAARDGTVAADGAGRNSPYAAALLKHIETPGLEVDFLFRNVRDDVMTATNNEQQPFVYGSLSSNEIYFKVPPVLPAAAEATPPPDAAEIAWSFLRATNDVSTLTRFVDRFPESSHVSDAKVRIASLATPPAPGVTDVSSPPLGQVVAFADTEFAQAEKAVARRFVRDTPVVEQAWDVIKESKDHAVIRHFVDRFPSAKRQVVADTRLAALGQKPITVRVAPRLLDVDETVLARAAVDVDVLRCFERGDQTATECLRAFERFPDIGRFAEDIRFTVGFCQAMGNPSGCVPTVKTAWNFPNIKIPAQTDPRPCPTCRKLGSPNVPAITNNAKPITNTILTIKSNPGGTGGHFHRHINTGALKLQQGNGPSGNTAGPTATGSKITNLKVTGVATRIKMPTIAAPAVKTDVKVNVRIPTPNIRVPALH
jgi:hypothetical protein